MKRKICLLVGWLAWSPLWAGTFPLELIERFDGDRVVAFVDEEELAATPAWQPFEQPPPLTLGAALERLAAFVRERGEDAEALRIQAVELRQVPHMKGRWHYLVRAATPAGMRFYTVLMNGRVVAAMQEPEPVK